MKKRVISLLLAVFVSVAALMPVNVLAQNDTELENIIKIAKSKINVPDSLNKFSYDINTDNAKKRWNLNWSGKDENAGNLSIGIDDKGIVSNYYYFKPYNNNQSKLPKVSRQDAKARAEEFSKRVNPLISSQMKFVENNNMNNYLGGDYTFNYIRIVNGIPFNSNNVFIEVNRETGEVQSYYANWNDALQFPSAQNAINLDNAKELFKTKIGMMLAYNYTMENEKVKVYPVYMPKYSNSYIDAISGEKIDTEYGGFPGYGGAYDKMASASMIREGKPNNLTPEEMGEIEKASKLITLEEAKSKAISSKWIGLSSSFKVVNSNLSKDWNDKEEYIWSIYFSEEEKDKGYGTRSANVGINAKTGEIKSFYISEPYKEDATAKIDEASSKAAVESFLKEFAPDKFNNSQYDDSYKGYFGPLTKENKPSQYSFRYYRKVNGVPFTGNALTVSYDAINGKVVSFESTWFNVQFPAIDNVVQLDAIYGKLFSEVGHELQYVMKAQPIPYFKAGIDPNGNSEIKLVYGFKQDKPQIFDANTGVLIDANGKPYKEHKTANYTDIAGNFAETQIKTLAEYGISLEGTEFKPNDRILQKDFFRLLAKTMNYYDESASFDDKAVENMYSFLIRENVVKNEEKAPNASLTREDAVKFIIRSMKLQKVADIKGIYVCNFKDAASINQDLTGYIVIANGLKIISGNGGYFSPKGGLTRAQAAVMIYNYLQN